jgi:hypothetical protein
MDSVAPPTYPVIARGSYGDDLVWRIEGRREGDQFCVYKLVVSRTTYRGGGGGGCHYRLPIDAGVSSDAARSVATGPVTSDATRVDIRSASGELIKSVKPIATTGQPESVYIAIVEGPIEPVEFIAFDADGRVVGTRKLSPVPKL